MQGPTATLVEQGTELDLVCWFYSRVEYTIACDVNSERKEILKCHVQQVQAQQILLYMVFSNQK